MKTFLDIIAENSSYQLRYKIYFTCVTYQMLQKTLRPLSPSVLSPVSWIDETASNIVSFIAIFNLGNKRMSAGAKSG
jgi:hypothetical protein